MSTVSRILAFLALAVVAAAAPAGALGAPDLRATPTGSAQPTVLLWGDGLFYSRVAFDHWLRQHKESYVAWSRAHPAALSILENAGSRPVRFRPSQFAPSGPAAPTMVAPATTRADGGQRRSPALLLGLEILAGLLLLTAAFPVRRLAPASPAAAALGERRLGLSAAAFAIFVGILAAKLAI
jgi:hypothetical protein